MAISVANANRLLSISLPEPLAEWVEKTAREQGTEPGELIQWAIRVYRNRLAGLVEELNEPLDPSNPETMTMAEVNDLVRGARQVNSERKTA